MADQSPSSVLRQAAARLREMASWLPHPWRLQVDDPASSIRRTIVDSAGDVCTTSLSEEAAWIVALSPAIAEPLAAMLERAASMYSLYDSRGWPADKVDRSVDAIARDALALAHLILGASDDGD